MNDMFNSGFPPGIDGQMNVDPGLNPQGVYQPGANTGYATGFYNQGYAAGDYNQGYYNNVPQGRIDGFGFVHYTKAQYLVGLRNYVFNLTGVTITKEERLDDVPQLLRHACAAAKISKLAQCYFQVPETGVSIPFFFCLACGKLYYPRDFV